VGYPIWAFEAGFSTFSWPAATFAFLINSQATRL
jgi:hypothetical protein